MKTEKLIICLLAFMMTVPAISQEIAVKSFAELPQDLAARTQEKQDANGNACALVKVVMPIQDVTFEGWVVEQQYTPGEYWVYMPEGTSKVKIKHKDLTPLVYEFSEKLVGKTTYQLVLEVNEVQKHFAFFQVKSNVKDCILYVDNNRYEAKSGKVEVRLPNGTYDFVLTGNNDRYTPIKGTINITDKDNIVKQTCKLEYTAEYLAEKQRKKEKRKSFWSTLGTIGLGAVAVGASLVSGNKTTQQ